jgi:hypothetical protein
MGRGLTLGASALVLASVAALAACGDVENAFDDDPNDPQLPPRGMSAIEPWLAARYHHGWSCEPMPRGPMGVSPHGLTRVCSNAVLAASTDSQVPIGSATVKEIYDGETLRGHAVSRKVTDDGLAGWYWYEYQRFVHADGMNEGSCPGCHYDAPTEMTWVIVR